MKTKRFVSTLLALLLICGLPLSAFADSWYLENGDITVNATESGQTVSQGAQVDVPDSAPVITQSNSSTPTENTVTIKAEENATANVTIQDVNIVIIDPAGSTQNHSGEAAVTIDVADGAEANVTLDGVNIDVAGTGGQIDGGDRTGEAAVQIVGNGDVTLELDGKNTLQGGNNRAGVEKNTIAATGTNPGSGNGNLTITDENGTAGSLESTGGIYGAGIGGGREGDGSNITITGSAEVTANGSLDAAGIGGGAYGSGSNITITGSAEVTAQGNDGGAGIGGGAYGSGSDITISGSAEVTAKGDRSGAGIGGGTKGSGSDITVSEDAQVKAQGGNGYHSPYITIGTGAAIGDGGKYIDSSSDNIAGDEVEPNTADLDEGWIATYAPGTANLDTAAPNSLTYKDNGQLTTSSNAVAVAMQEPTCTEAGHKAGFKIGNTQVGGETIPATGHSFTNYVFDNNATYDADGTKTAKCDHCDATHTIPDPGSKLVREEPAQTAPLYRVVGKDGKALACKTEQENGVLTITVDADFATLTGKLGGIQTLKAQGVDTIVFVTNGATSTFALSDLLSQGSTGDSYTLTHDGSTVTFTLGAAKTDVSGILAKP